MEDVKIEYWKRRINTQMNTLFLQVVNELREIKEEVVHIGGDEKEFASIFKMIGDSFDMLKYAVDDIGKVKEEVKEEK